MAAITKILPASNEGDALTDTATIQVTVTSSAVGNVMFDVLNEFMEDVPDATITFQNQEITELIYTVKTASDGTATQFDIPEGRYIYNVSPPAGHLPTSGTFEINAGLITPVYIALEMKLVDITWSVVPTTIQDVYEIKITQTFETNVPAPVLVLDPPNIALPDLKPGEVFNGEFKVTNYGLIAVFDVKLDFPNSYGDHDIEVLTEAIPDRIEAMQSITVPYKITRRQVALAFSDTGYMEMFACREDTLVLHTDLLQDIAGFGGACYDFQGITIMGKCIICPNTAAQKVVDKVINFILQFFMTCSSSGATGTGSGSGPGANGPGQLGGGSLPGGSPSTIPAGNCECMNCDDNNPCTDDSCSGGICIHTPNNNPCADDGNECTNDVCSNKVCTHPPKSGTCRDDGNDCTDDTCNNGTCTHPVKADNTPCRDDGKECTDDVCNSGSCAHPNKPDGPLTPDQPDDCVDKTCIGGNVQTIADNGEVPPQGSPTDCKKEICQDKKSVSVPNDSEDPENECEMCKNGSPVPRPDGPILPDEPTDCVDKACINGALDTVADNGETPLQGPDDDCLRYECENKVAVPKPNPGETPPQASEHDCRTDICKADGTIGWTKNDGEQPLNECKLCKDGSEANKPDGPLTPDQPDDCVDKSCVDGVVDTVADNSETPPQGPNDDCLRYECENKVAVAKGNPNETPSQTSEHDCRTDICTVDGPDWQPNNGEQPLNECTYCQAGYEQNKANGTPVLPDDPTDCIDKVCTDGSVTTKYDKTETPPSECEMCTDSGKANRPNGTSCTDDGNLCTLDSCTNGTCDHPAKDCTYDHPCVDGMCNATTGDCEYTLRTGPISGDNCNECKDGMIVPIDKPECELVTIKITNTSTPCESLSAPYKCVDSFISNRAHTGDQITLTAEAKQGTTDITDQITWTCADAPGGIDSGTCIVFGTGAGSTMTFVPNPPAALTGRTGPLAYLVRARIYSNGVYHEGAVTITQDNLDELRQEYEDLPLRNSQVRPNFDQETPAYTALLGPAAEPSRHQWHFLRSLNQNARNVDTNYSGDLRITSGYRCPVGNQRLESQGASPTSNHQYGHALDFNQQDSWENYNAFDAALRAEAGGDSYLSASDGTRYFQRTNPPPSPDELPQDVTYVQGHVSWE